MNSLLYTKPVNYKINNSGLHFHCPLVYSGDISSQREGTIDWWHLPCAFEHFSHIMYHGTYKNSFQNLSFLSKAHVNVNYVCWGRSFKMAEEWEVEITFLPTNTSEIRLHVEQLLQNTYWTLAEDLRPPKRQETPPHTWVGQKKKEKKEETKG